MALELVQPGIQPLGQFDGADSVYLNVKGGEVGAITNLTIATDSGAADVDDGYIPGGTYRPGITTALSTGMRPLGLIDDGIWGYGTLFGSVIGGIAGQVSYGLGQHRSRVAAARRRRGH